MGSPEEVYAECITAISAAVGDDAAKALLLCQQFASSEDTADSIAGVTVGVNTLYLVLCGALVFVMHAGFAMLCAGAVRSKNAMNILLQTVMDAAVSAVAFYTVGYGFAYGYGDKPNEFIGDSLFALSNWVRFNTNNTVGENWQAWFFQWAFAATATTIPAGAVAERLNFNAYIIYSFIISAFVYPVVVHWVWSGSGWLGAWKAEYPLFGAGMIDFAGSGVVHMVGGFAGLAGCLMLGPRMGRFDSNGHPVEMPGHSATLYVLGTVLLWFGWYGFNPGSQLVITSIDNAAITGRAAVTTTLAGAAGCLSTLMTALIRTKSWDLVCCCNGALCGFVAITANAHVVEPWAALICGLVGGWVFDLVCWLFLKFKIDDPLSAAPLHGFVGAFGVFFAGLLAKQEYICQAYQRDRDCGDNTPAGLFYTGKGRLLASQVIGILSIFAWVFGLMSIVFGVLKFFGKLRISAEMEQAGLDVSKHGGSAYNYDHGLGKPEKAQHL